MTNIRVVSMNQKPSPIVNGVKGVRGEVYKINRGDNLSLIAQNRFGNQRYWLALWKYNNDRCREFNDKNAMIRNPNLILETNTLYIPTEAELEKYLLTKNLAKDYINTARRENFYTPLTTMPAHGKMIADVCSDIYKPLIAIENVDKKEMTAALRAISRNESSGRAYAVNIHSAALGLFQIMPINWSDWAKEAGLDEEAPATVENQIKIASFRIRKYYLKYGNWDDVFAAWYGGEGAVKRRIDTGSYDNRKTLNLTNDYPPIEKYVRDIRKTFNSYLAQI